MKTLRKFPSVAQRSKPLPAAIDLEESVLGALLLETDALTEVIDILKSNHFSREQNKLIYKAIVQLFNANEAIDPRTVVNQLRKAGTLKRAGGAAYLASLMDSVASASHITNHARIIVEYAIRRMLIHLANDIHHSAHDETIETFYLLDKAEQTLFDVSETNIRKNYTSVDSLMHEAFQQLERKKATPNGIIGVPTGFIDLDRIMFGWQKADFAIVAARPGMGKTAFLLSLLRNAAVDHQIPAAFFSIEMSSSQLMQRLLSIESCIESTKLQRGTLEPYEWQQLYHKTSALTKAPIYIDDSPNLSIFEFRAKCRRLKSQKNVQVIFLDYLQLMIDDSTQRKGNIEQQIATISRGIKCIAKELNISIIAASQLSRSVEVRGGDKRPQLSDLRYSGSIEQDADRVLFLYRPEYYGLTQDEKGNDTQELAEIILAKNRNGPTGKTTMRFIASSTKFMDWVAKPPNLVYPSKLNKSLL